jgi:hypothetical protein
VRRTSKDLRFSRRGTARAGARHAQQSGAAKRNPPSRARVRAGEQSRLQRVRIRRSKMTREKPAHFDRRTARHDPLRVRVQPRSLRRDKASCAGRRTLALVPSHAPNASAAVAHARQLRTGSCYYSARCGDGTPESSFGRADSVSGAGMCLGTSASHGRQKLRQQQTLDSCKRK